MRAPPLPPAPLRRPAGLYRALVAATLFLAGCTGLPRGVAPVEDFAPRLFTGTWYEIVRLDHAFEEGLTNVRATYRLREDGTVAVFNRAWNPDACTWETVSGTARLQAGPSTGSFAVDLAPSPFPGALHVIAMDPAGEQWAMTAGPTRDFLWILSRERTLPRARRVALMRRAHALGFPVEDLVRVDQTGPICRSR